MEADMRRRVLTISLLMLLSLPLFAVSGGWGISGEGQSGRSENTSFLITGVFDFTDSRYLTLEGSARFGFDVNGRWGFNGLAAELGFTTFRLLDHPFSFLFENATIWTPRIAGGISTDRSWNLYYAFSFSLLHFEEVSYSYDFLEPHIYFDSSFRYAGWGIKLLKLTYTF